MLSPEEQTRYDRQIMIHGFGEAGQEKLKNSKVVIAGAGGLGSPVSIYLAAAGIGYIRIIDRDVVELSNLNRQVLHWHKDIGRKKAESAAEKLKAMNPGITVEGLNIDINETNVEEVVKGFDVIVDAMDNLATRLLLNKAALKLKIPFVHGAIHGFEGHAMTVIPGSSACVRCLYKAAPPKQKFPVIGTTPAVIASIQATETIKILTGLGMLLTNRLVVYDGQSMRFTVLHLQPDTNCDACGNPVP
jgi:molybdopterin/thiamine biosynthesis adenylyltransferase